MTPNKTERKKIKIKSINPPRPIPGKDLEVTEFMGEDNVKYEVWSPTLVAELKEGGEIDADIVHSEKETQNGTFYHNKVTQIYVDGRPVKVKQGGKGYNQGYSPEERASIEAQTAVKAVLGLIPHCGEVAEVLNITADLSTRIEKSIKKALDWCDLKVDANMKPDASAPKPLTKKAEAKTTKATEPTGEFANAGDFLKVCLDTYGLNRTQVLAELNATTLENIDLKAAWQTIKGPRQEKP